MKSDVEKEGGSELERKIRTLKKVRMKRKFLEYIVLSNYTFYSSGRWKYFKDWTRNHLETSQITVELRSICLCH